MIMQACRTLARLAAVAALGALLAGCLVRTETFLSERADASVDERLLGAWSVEPDQPDTSSLFVRGSDNGGLDILVVELTDGESTAGYTVGWEEAVVWPTKIDGAGYLNVKSEDANTILAYVVTPEGALEIGYMDPKNLAEAVRSGQLKGEIENGFFKTVTLSDSRDNLIAFIRANGGHDLFVFGEKGDGDGGARLALMRRSPIR